MFAGSVRMGAAWSMIDPGIGSQPSKSQLGACGVTTSERFWLGLKQVVPLPGSQATVRLIAPTPPGGRLKLALARPVALVVLASGTSTTLWVSVQSSCTTGTATSLPTKACTTAVEGNDWINALRL